MNPYRKVIKKEKGLPKTSSFLNKKGKINASSVSDLLVQIGSAMQDQESAPLTSREKADRSQERRQVLVEAMNDNTNRSMEVLGEALASEIYETANREGFARRILQYRELGAGESGEVVLKDKNVIAYMATSPSEVNAMEIRQRSLYPPEFHINSYILIDTVELGKSSSDLLEEKYDEGLEATMVQEDRLWRIMADKAAVVRNTLQTGANLTPAILARTTHQVSRWGIPATTCLLSSDLWEDIIAGSEFAAAFDPVTKWELLQEGYLGSMYGIALLTDSFRQKNLRVLAPGEMYVVGAAVNHGVMSMRGSMIAEPINKFAQGEAKKGWFLDEILSLVVGNAMSVAKFQKI